jgi:hypothetical protein
MKLKSIVLAVAAASGVIAGQAHAFAPGAVTDINLYVSGATAQDEAFLKMFKDNFCKSDFDAFASSGDAKAQRAFSCKLDSAKIPGMSVVDPTITVYKRSSGGSGMGVQPVADGASIEFMNVAPWDGVSKGCQVMAAGTQPSGFPIGTYNCSYNATTDRQMHVSDAGLSDVEPALFVGVNVPAGFTDVTAAQVAKMDVVSVRAGVFGIPVTKALRDALQQAQGLVVGDETEANMPSLSKVEVASLMADGGIKKWSDFYVNGVPLTTISATYGSSNKVTICRRVNGSGTQAQFNANFLAYPCVNGAAQPENLSNLATGPLVVMNSGSGDVETCLKNANDNSSVQKTDANGKYLVNGDGTPAMQTVSKWALGVQSTEKNSTNSKNYRFIKIDGVTPTSENVWNSTYMDWVEESMQWRKVAEGGPVGDMLKVLQTMASEAGKPANTNLTSVNQSWGRTGYLTVPSLTYPTDSVWNAANPVNTATRGTPVNNCRVPLAVKKLVQ